MSKKIRCGNIGIDLNQICFWQHIPSLQEAGFQSSKHEFLHLYTSSVIINIRKILPGGEVYQSDQNLVVLEEKVFDKLVEYLHEEFSCNLSE